MDGVVTRHRAGHGGTGAASTEDRASLNNATMNKNGKANMGSRVICLYKAVFQSHPMTLNHTILSYIPVKSCSLQGGKGFRIIL